MVGLFLALHPLAALTTTTTTTNTTTGTTRLMDCSVTQRRDFPHLRVLQPSGKPKRGASTQLQPIYDSIVALSIPELHVL